MWGFFLGSTSFARQLPPPRQHRCPIPYRMNIRNIQLGSRPVLLAPMEDVTDIGFRLLCRRLGASMVYSEFVAADALVRSVNKTFQKLKVSDVERPVAIQTYGRFPDAVEDAAEIIVETAHPDILDLNFGCPVKRVAGKGAGAGMLQTPDLMLDIIRRVVHRVGGRVPVTVKTRLGWDVPGLYLDTTADGKRIPFIVDLAERIQDAGAEALTIHGRTRSQMYTGQADWALIGEVKRNPRMHIPIIGNGDITNGEQAKRAFEDYGVDAVMVGRATFGRPWIFREIRDTLDGTSTDMTADWKLDILKEQIHESIERIDEYRGILHIRRHLAASPLFKGIPNFRETRIAMLQAETEERLYDILEQVRPIVREYSGNP